VIEAPHLSTLVIGQQRHTDHAARPIAARVRSNRRAARPLAPGGEPSRRPLKFVRNPGADAECSRRSYT